jgi:hypothetical protein
MASEENFAVAANDPGRPAPDCPDAQLGLPPADPNLEAAERDERQTERQAPDTAGPGEPAGGG